eukprot:3739738-Alexandrium_andersonii.AAC.1
MPVSEVLLLGRSHGLDRKLREGSTALWHRARPGGLGLRHANIDLASGSSRATTPDGLLRTMASLNVLGPEIVQDLVPARHIVRNLNTFLAHRTNPRPTLLDLPIPTGYGARPNLSISSTGLGGT